MICRIRHLPAIILLPVFVLGFQALPVQAKVTSPKEQFGFNIGDDYQLVNYTRLLAYWKRLDAESDRMTLVDIGRTAEGRPMVMAIITSPKNQGRLGRLKEIARRLALAKGFDDVILLAVPSNPDGLELVADWYMREKDPAKRSMSGVPVLYQKYIGHDNNRDSYMATQPETEAVNRVLYREWHPQILYNHHQSGPAGTVLFAPPFRDPFNYVFDPLIPVGIDLVSAAMHNRFVAEGKPGVIMRSGASYSTAAGAPALPGPGLGSPAPGLPGGPLPPYSPVDISHGRVASRRLVP